MSKQQAAEKPLTAQEARKRFLKLFKQLTNARSDWEVWADFVTAVACSLANATEFDPVRRAKREKEYAECIQRLGGTEVLSEMTAMICIALTRNPRQDFLGEIYMELALAIIGKGSISPPITSVNAWRN